MVTETVGDEDKVNVVNSCCLRWRMWIRPVVMSVYFIILLIVLPLLIIKLWKSNYDIKFQVWIVGGIFTLLAVPISLWDITQHLVHYTKPKLQKYIIRVLWMVPIYALNAWLGLTFPDYAIYMDTCRECYEAYAIYNFMMFLLTYLDTEMDAVDDGGEDTHISHIFPLCCIKPWVVGSDLVHFCKHGILQYTVIRPITTIISLICEVCGVYGDGKFQADVAYPYMIAINNLSQFVAMYCLVLFYRAHKEGLKPMRPIGKFLCIKAVVFFSFFQGVIIAILVFTGLISSWFEPKDAEHVPQGIQNFLICNEMFLAAVAHHFSFSYRPYVDYAREQHGCCFAFLHMWDVSDVRRDFAEHIHVIGNSVRRRVAGRPHSYDGASVRSARGGDERKALLQSSPPDGSSSSRRRSYQAMSDSDHEGINAGLTALREDQKETDDSAVITVHVDVEPSIQAAQDFIDLTGDSSIA